MALQETAKPASGRCAEPVSKIEQLGGRLNIHNTPTPAVLQVVWLSRRFAISLPTAIVVSSLCFREERQ